MNWRLAAPEVAYIVNDAEAKVFVVGEEFVPVLDAIEGDLTTVKKIVIVGCASSPRVVRGLDRLVTTPTDPGLQAGRRRRRASSSTRRAPPGLPKGVMLTNDNLFAADATGSAGGWLFTPDSVNLVAMPLFHIGGGGWACVGLYRGLRRRASCARSIRPRSCKIIEERKVTHAFLVPAVLQFMLHAARRRRAPTSPRCEMIVYGASPISATGARGLASRTFGCDFIQAYGLTETTGAVVALLPEDHDPDGPERAPAALARASRSTASSCAIVDAGNRRRCRRSARSARSGCARRRT